MTYIDDFALLIAAAGLAIAGWVVVQCARQKIPMSKVDAELTERAAQYQSVLQAHVDRRVEVVNEMARKVTTFRKTPVKGPETIEPPTPDELRPNMLDEQAEREREIAELFPTHPDAMRRDEINVEP